MVQGCVNISNVMFLLLNCGLTAGVCSVKVAEIGVVVPCGIY